MFWVSIPHRIEKNFYCSFLKFLYWQFPSLIGLRKTPGKSSHRHRSQYVSIPHRIEKNRVLLKSSFLGSVGFHPS